MLLSYGLSCSSGVRGPDSENDASGPGKQQGKDVTMAENCKCDDTHKQEKC